MPWQKNYNETIVLERAMHAFWAHGYEATSMNDLVRTTGINRASIYNAYPGKHALFMSVLKHYDKVYRGEHLQTIADKFEPRDAIVAAFETASKKPADRDTPWGCLLVNTALELSPHDAEVAEFVDQSLQAVEAFFFSQIDLAKADGTIGAALDSRSSAKALLGLFLGLRVLTRTNIRQDSIDAITAQARSMLG